LKKLVSGQHSFLNRLLVPYSPLVKAQTAAIQNGLIFLSALFAVGRIQDCGRPTVTLPNPLYPNFCTE
jgi:hypothetical protein